MSNIDIEGLRIDVAAPVGALTKAKVDEIKKVFITDELKLSLALNDMVLFEDKKTGQILFITINQISLGFKEVPVFNDALKRLEKLFDALLLDKKATCRIRIIGRLKSDGSSMEHSKSFVKVDINEAYPSLSGIGLRFIEVHGDDVWEFKVEPLIKDEKFYHLEGVFNYNEKNELESITKHAEDAYTYYNTKLVNMAEHLFLK